MKDVAAVVAFVVAVAVAEMSLLLPLLSVEVIEDCVDCAVAVGF